MPRQKGRTRGGEVLEVARIGHPPDTVDLVGGPFLKGSLVEMKTTQTLFGAYSLMVQSIPAGTRLTVFGKTADKILVQYEGEVWEADPSDLCLV